MSKGRTAAATLAAANAHAAGWAALLDVKEGRSEAVGSGNAAVNLENEAVRIQNEAVNFRNEAVKQTSVPCRAEKRSINKMSPLGIATEGFDFPLLVETIGSWHADRLHGA